MISKYKYPVDSDQFESIRERGKVYVDKTDMVFRLVDTYDYVFLARPRRFGKSLLCNTFKAYFQGKKELFDGLAIASLEREWKQYPVFHFKMSGLKNLSIENAKAKLGEFISYQEKGYGTTDPSLSPGTRFARLLQNAHSMTGMKVVVLIDEYDTPIVNLLDKLDERNAMRTMLREFYQVLKDEGEHIRFVFMTGITRFSQLSIFSELNNLKNISMLQEYSGLCGITRTELETTMRPHVAEFAERLGCPVEEAYAMLRENYDGYHFCENGEDVYAPYSLLNALNDGKIQEYWFKAATPSSLIENLRRYPATTPLQYDGIQVDLDAFDISCEDASTPMPLLYQSGYLSIDAYDRLNDVYTLHFPNKEVRNGMIKNLMPTVMKQSSEDTDALVIKMSQNINDGNLSAALLCLRSYIAGIPYDIITKEEWDNKEKREAFFKLLLYMSFSMLNSRISCEHKCILGRADVVVRTKTDIFVLELKVDDAVDNALAQIDDKDYAIQWSDDGRRIFRCGVRIDSGKRNLTHWRIIDQSGDTIDEQIFE